MGQSQHVSRFTATTIFCWNHGNMYIPKDSNLTVVILVLPAPAHPIQLYITLNFSTADKWMGLGGCSPLGSYEISALRFHFCRVSETASVFHK